MMPFARLFRWPMWTSIWGYISSLFWNFFRLIPDLPKASPAYEGGEDVERGSTGEVSHARNPPVTENFHSIVRSKHSPLIEQSSNQELLSIGLFAEVYLVDNKIIRKAPRSGKAEDLEPIVREATIYTLLGDHPRIAECLSPGNTDYIDIRYYPHGDLVTYCQRNEILPDLQSKWFQQLIEAIVAIHSNDIIHSDLALRQFFVDDELNVRLGDFNSSQYPGHPALGYEKASHCLPRDYEMPNTIMSDLFALGSTLYELVVGKGPYNELYPVEPEDVIQSSDHDVIRARVQRQHCADFEVEERYRKRIFPDVSKIFGGNIILGCWKGDFASAEEALRQYKASQKPGR